MQAFDEDDVDIVLAKKGKKSCFMRYLALLWLPLLIFLGVIAGYKGVIPFKVEIHSVVMIGAIFFIYFFFIKHNATYATCKFDQQYEEMRIALKWYIKNNILVIDGISKSNAPYDSFMKEYTAGIRNDNFASVAAAVFPTLGILGTFISIALSMPDFSSQNSAQLEREISLLLGGVGTAFYVSIYGIFLSLWWIFFEKSGMSHFEAGILAIKKQLSHHFWSRDEIEQMHLSKSLESYKKLGETFETLSSNTFADTLHESLKQRISLFDTIIVQEQNALQKSSAHFNALSEESHKSMEQSARLLEAYESIAGSMQQMTAKLDKNTQILERSLHMVAQQEVLLENSISKLHDALEPIKAENVAALHSSVLQNLEIMKSESAKVGYAFNKNLEDFDEKYTKKLRHSLELIDSETAKIIHQIAELRVIDRR